MKSKELETFCEYNIVTKEWHKIFKRTNKLLFQFQFLEKLEEFQYDYLEDYVKRLMIIFEEIFVNDGIKSWFKEFVENQNVYLLWVLQEINHDSLKAVEKFNEFSSENLKQHKENMLNDIKQKEILKLLEE